MNEKLSTDSLAILLLCTSLAIPYKAENVPKPLTPSEWESLSRNLRQQNLRPSSFFELPVTDWSTSLSLAASLSDRIERLLARSGQLSLELERLSGLGIWVITRAENDYPPRWKKRLGQKCPIVLYGAGDRTLLRPKGAGVAIVGSRDVDEAGTQFAEQLGARCARDGMFVVSGGAKGVDSLAQQSALQNGGRVISILSEGLEGTIKKKEIRTSILTGNLLVLSAVAPKARFTAYQAMARNKYVYALSDVSVVVSSALKGGTWNGAVENLENAWVPLFVRKGQQVPAGNQQLLTHGAHPIMENLLDSDTLHLPTWFHSHTATKQDLFDLVWPTIQQELRCPKREDELAQTLNVLEEQVSLWLARALASGKVKKLPTSDHYVDIQHAPTEQQSLFEQ